MKTRREILAVAPAVVAATVAAPALATASDGLGIQWQQPQVPMPPANSPIVAAACDAWNEVLNSVITLRDQPIVYGKTQNFADGEDGRALNGYCLNKLPPIYGSGLEDDAPGLNAMLEDRCCEPTESTKAGEPLPAKFCPTLPADRLYRIHSPITARGALNFSPAGYKWQTVWFPHAHPDHDLSSPFEEGEVRLFWFDFAEGDPEMNTALRVVSVKPGTEG